LIYLVAQKGENPTNEAGFSLIEAVLNHGYFIHKYSCMDVVYHDEERFSPHKATKTAYEAKNIDDHLFWKS
jgi:hypothetical protein